MSIIEDLFKKKKKYDQKKEKSTNSYKERTANIFVGKASKSEPTPLFMRNK